MGTSSGWLTTIPRAWCGVALSVALLSACGNDSSAPNPIPPDARGATPLAPLALARAGTPIPDRYIVVFKPEVQDAPGEARRQVTAGHGQLHFTYTHAIKGYAATLSPAALDAVRATVVLALPFITEVWHIYVLIAVLQSASAAFTPTFQAVIPDIVTKESDYTRALSASQVA